MKKEKLIKMERRLELMNEEEHYRYIGRKVYAYIMMCLIMSGIVLMVMILS